jgi:antitoxin ParD1/3/4
VDEPFAFVHPGRLVWQSLPIFVIREVSVVATLNISLPDAMRAWIDAQVEAGEYANASDYIRDLIRHDQRERDAVRLALIDGERSGRSVRTVTDIARQTKRRLKRA